MKCFFRKVAAIQNAAIAIIVQIRQLPVPRTHMKRAQLAWRPMSGLVLLALTASLCTETQAVPSFTRQTGLKCNVCHSNPPELTAFGRKFKLDGYTLTDKNVNTTIEDKDLKINRYFPISVMLLLSDTATNTPVPGAQNGNAGFPQALSLFLAGEISPHLGGMVQGTYSHQSDHFTQYGHPLCQAHHYRFERPVIWDHPEQ